jgi:hypothetical protein
LIRVLLLDWATPQHFVEAAGSVEFPRFAEVAGLVDLPYFAVAAEHSHLELVGY